MSKFALKEITELMTFSKDFFEECAFTKKGFNIIYITENTSNGFSTYVSTNYELGTLIRADLTRMQSMLSVVYVVNCETFRKYSKLQILDMAYNMGFLLFGIRRGGLLVTDYGLIDSTDDFLNVVDRE